MSLYNYVDSPNSNLICCICRMPFTDPTTSRTCAHTFCKDCILRAVDHSSQCPVDRSPLTPAHLVPANPIVRSLVDELVVECVHRAKGCAHTCQRQFLATHLLESCIFREVSCTLGKCEEMIIFRDAALHTHGEDGSDAVPVASVDATENPVTGPDSAPSSPVAAPVGETRDEPLTPLGLSSTTITSATADASQAGAAPSEDPRIATLAEQNILLRRRVESLEGLLHGFQREMGAVKRALGPWFRAGIQPLSASMSTNMGIPAAELPTAVDPLSHSYPPHYTTPPPMPSADSLAPYFPSEVEERSAFQPVRRPPAHTHRSAPNLDFLNSSQQPVNAYTHVPMVAPLDLSTNLEGTLHGLRESVVGLATSLDSMGRTHEIALTNEAIRMGEEVGGLRAGVHGLRMQVHAIMMNRNAQLTGRDGVGEGGGPGQWMPPPIPPPSARIYYAQQPSITKL